MNTSLSKYFGNYPAEYNRAVHGPYDPARFYGKGKRCKLRVLCFETWNFARMIIITI